MTNGVPVGEGEPGEVPRPELGCDTPACVAALAELVRLRNVIVFKCGQIAAARSRTQAMAAVAAVLFTIASGLFIAGASACATFWGCLAGVVLMLAGLAFLGAALTYATFAGIGFAQIAVLEGELNRARSDFTNAADAVTKACPTSCWGDLTAPTCTGS